MVALKWDQLRRDELERDEPDDAGETDRRSTRPRLYLSEDRPRPTGSRRSRPRSPRSPRSRGRRVYARRDQRRWRFAVRRALVVLVIASLGALAWSVAERLAAVASTGGGTAAACRPILATAPGPAQSAAGAVRRSGGLGSHGTSSCPQAYVATAGDTVWSIALKFDHGGDPRPLVDRLEAEIGGGVLQPGQRLAVP